MRELIRGVDVLLRFRISLMGGRVRRCLAALVSFSPEREGEREIEIEKAAEVAKTMKYLMTKRIKGRWHKVDRKERMCRRCRLPKVDGNFRCPHMLPHLLLPSCFLL